MSIYEQIQKNLSDYYKIIQKQYSAKYVKEFIIGTGIILSLFIGYFLHGFYIKRREAQAFGALYEVVEAFEKSQYTALTSDKTKDKEKIENSWQDTEVLLDALYKEHMGSYLAPYFQLFKAEIALEKGASVDDARKMLEEALVLMPKHSSLFELFELKRIKMAFDSQDPKVREVALEELVAFAHNEESSVFEEALYSLGAYYMYQGDAVQASDMWKKLTKYSDKDALVKSPWIKLAEEKLGLLKE